MYTTNDFDYEVLMLSDLFYNTYPNPPYVEILKKRKRAYNCILFQTSYNYLICVPYRTEISHQYAYKFTSSNRSQSHRSGLDYTKMIIVKDMNFISSTTALIDKDEYNETVQNIVRIKNEAMEFLDSYINHNNGTAILHPREVSRRFSRSSLHYFHSELGLQ